MKAIIEKYKEYAYVKGEEGSNDFLNLRHKLINEGYTQNGSISYTDGYLEEVYIKRK